MARHPLINRQPSRPLIAPSVLGADFSRLGDECRSTMQAGADLLHLDVMDGHFVPNLTMGPALCGSLAHALPEVCLDVHLMVNDPGRYVEAFARAGASHLTYHLEVESDPRPLADAIRGQDMTVGLAINPNTAAAEAMPFAGHFDLILVMSVNPGFAGQAFIPEVLDKARAFRSVLRHDQRLQIDGGVDLSTAPQCREAGCDILVAATAIFGAVDYHEAIDGLRGSGRPAEAT